MTTFRARGLPAQPHIPSAPGGRWLRPASLPSTPLPLSLLAGLALLVVVAISSILAHVLAPHDPWRAAGTALQQPGANHWFGTDDLGRDVLSRVLHGGRVSLLVGALVALTSATVAVLVGGIAGYAGRRTDDLLRRLTELVQVLPRLFLAIIVAVLFGRSAWVTGLLLGLTTWPATARLLRAQVLSLREREFVLAARTLGAPGSRVLWRHVLPHAFPIVLISAALHAGTAMLIEAGLAFLGLGDPAAVSWGAMLNAAQLFLRTAWWTSFFPGLALLTTVLAVNLAADGLQDLADPRLRASGARRR